MGKNNSYGHPKENVLDTLSNSKIYRTDVDALLIVNETKNDQKNYIGANGFAELAFGFYKGKTIFLLNDIYKPYSEELIAWEVIPLKGNLEKIIKFIKD